MTAYKVLSRGMASCHGGRKKWTPGKRHSVRGELRPCRNGLHICRDERDLLSWPGETICPVVEHSGEYVDEGNKRVVRWCVIGEPIPYWNERTARHFACDCAEYALRYADESQVEILQACIDITRAYADWPEDWKEERADAWVTAGAVARAAARDVSWAAARDVSWAAAWDVSWAVALDVSCAVARDVSWAVAWAAARDAAWDAAGATARAAAGATAWAVALDAGGAVAWAAARDVALDDIAAILATYLDGTNELVTEQEA